MQYLHTQKLEIRSLLNAAQPEMRAVILGWAHPKMVDITQCVTSPLSLTLCGLSSPPLGPQAGGARSFGITSHGAPGHLL